MKNFFFVLFKLGAEPAFICLPSVNEKSPVAMRIFPDSTRVAAFSTSLATQQTGIMFTALAVLNAKSNGWQRVGRIFKSARASKVMGKNVVWHSSFFAMPLAFYDVYDEK